MLMESPDKPDTYMSGLPAEHPKIKVPKVGVLLLNLGTPDATDYWSMRRYLKEFLSDRRVIDYNRVAWWLLLNLIILSKRPFTAGAAYKEIWNEELDESPLRTLTRNQTNQLIERLKAGMPDIVIDWGMRYGNPSTQSRLEALREAGCTRILLFALYPQYSAATTATAYDKAFDALKQMRWQPAVRTAPPYHDDPVYIRAIADSVRSHLATLDWEPEVVLTSFHGVPKRYLLLGDPYHCQCAKTWRLVNEELGWPEGKLRLTFQSRFGSEEWLQPYTDETCEKLAKEEGIKRLAIITPGFSADCVETLEEINGEAQEIFRENGGEQFTFIPCLNDSAGGMDVIESVVRRELQGWL